MTLQLLSRKSGEASISYCLWDPEQLWLSNIGSQLSVREPQLSGKVGDELRPRPPQCPPGPAEGCLAAVKLADGFSRDQTIKLILLYKLC